MSNKNSRPVTGRELCEKIGVQRGFDGQGGCRSIKELRLLQLVLSVPVSGGPMVDVHIIKQAMDAVKELIQFRELLHELKVDAPNENGELRLRKETHEKHKKQGGADGTSRFSGCELRVSTVRLW